MKNYTLIIAEKPNAAKVIANALADGKPKKNGEGNKVWFSFTKDKKKFMVVPAVGHLFTLKQRGKGWYYPAFDAEWVPSFKASLASRFSEPYFRNMERLAKDAKDFIVATDYDTEGAVIGYNILRFLCGRKDAKRMRFSTMTKEELIDSYKNMQGLDKALIESGLTRHFLDYYWGISLTRALTNAIKSAGERFRILSTGRVQGPTLHMLAKHERKIKAFKPTPFWQIELEVKIGKLLLKAAYEKDKIWDKNEADTILKKIKGKNAIVKCVKKKEYTQKPPIPYNTSGFLSDAYRYFGYSPRQALNIAEELYQRGYISYPRTNSQQLPSDIGFEKILRMLAKQKQYEKLVSLLLNKKELKPYQGKKTDRAHPPIYPTGEIPKRLGTKQQKVYDLIVHRFLAVFGDNAKRESVKIILDVNGNTFFLNGKRTVEPGWTELYGRYAKRDEVILPEMKKGDKLIIKKVNQLEKQTQPPPRFSQGSVIKEMEARGLGTQATRALILQILYNRGYLVGNSVEVTELGMNLSNILEKNVSDVVSERLTRRFEEKIDAIQEGKAKMQDVLEEAKKKITKICNAFKKKEAKIGEELTEAVIKTQDKQSILGKCKCGGVLKVFKMWRTGTRFVGCTRHNKGCKIGYPLPRNGLIISTDKECGECRTPIIQVRPQGRKPFRMCLDPKCPKKKEWYDEKKLRLTEKRARK